MSENATPWVEGLTVGQVLGSTAKRHASRDAAFFPAQGLALSYREFAAEVDAAARGLLALGIG
jgi:non-ribosomal peptide synthetase component E (peptide arylation enzyme)